MGTFSTSGLVFVKMIGIGLVIALDTSVVRALLDPATMRLLGRANWWAPALLARWWQRHGFRDSGSRRGPADSEDSQGWSRMSSQGSDEDELVRR
ncbi:MAG TPA: MMPL family transporter [Kribbella sp.]|nr:MMPL family transporter [Kribbella sp.]